MNQWVPFQSFVKGPVKAGGLCEIYGVPVDWIVRFPGFNPATQYLDGDIVLGYQKYWLRFQVAPTDKGFSEELKYLKGRPFWEQRLQFRLNWQSGSQHIKLNNMANHRWVFLVKEAGTGIFYVIGKPDVGADISASYNNQQGTITQISASFKAIHRAPLYNGVNRAVCRIVDVQGNFIRDADGNYLAVICDMVTPPDPGGAEFSNEYSNEFFIP